MNFTRRDLMKIALGTTGYALLSPLYPSLGFAQRADRNFIPKLLLHLRVNGGWDTPMSMDSFDINQLKARGITSTEYAFENARTPMMAYKHGYLGSCMKPLQSYLSDISIVNGIMMISDNSVHEVNRDYMSKGTTDRSAGFTSIQMAKQLNKLSPQRVAYRLEYEQFELAGHTSVAHLSTLDKSGEGSSKSNTSINFEEALLDKATADDNERDLQGSIVRQGNTEAPNLQKLAQLTPQIKQQFTDGSEETKNLANALAGLASGYVQMACVDIVRDRDLDTHSNHVDFQTTNLTEGMRRIAKTIDILKSTPYYVPVNGQSVSLFDITTVVVTGEFARTSWMEGSSGSSHNQKNNSAILFGRGIQGGQLIGRSQIYSSKTSNNQGRSSLHAVPFDFKSNTALNDEQVKLLGQGQPVSIGLCKPEACIDYIYPETIWRAVAKTFDIKELPDIGLGISLDVLLKKQG